MSKSSLVRKLSRMKIFSLSRIKKNVSGGEASGKRQPLKGERLLFFGISN